MSEGRNDMGMIGLAVMGRNLVLNMADHGFAVAVFNRTESVTREFASQLEAEQPVQPCYSLEELVGSLKKPHRVMMMVKSGKPVDAVIAELEPLLEPGDVLIDGGNSYFKDTDRREKSLAEKGIHFFGVGISGGEFGARHGPSMMPGGPKEAYQSVRDVFEAIAARADGESCVSYLGPGAAGHYVKMVHNGIEYGFMQLIAETYALMKLGSGLTNEELAGVFADWNGAELNSYLVEITSHIFQRLDEKTGRHLVDLIRGEAGHLGTGKWTSQSAMDLGVPAPNIDVAVAMRNLSDLEDQRSAMAASSPHVATSREKPEWSVGNVRNALYASMIITYAQGFAHLQSASKVLEFGFRLEDVAAIWRGGCIIRSALLREIKAAFRRRPELPNLLLDSTLSQAVISRRDDLVRAVEAGASAGIAVPGLMTALGYLDAYRAEWLPSNLIQAQRDYFGAHTYQRVDEEGIFHTDWLADQRGL